MQTKPEKVRIKPVSPAINKAKYHLVFEGKLKGNADITVVKKNLLSLFNNKSALVEQLFLKKKVLLKKTISKQKALQYKRHFEKSGALCIIKRSVRQKAATHTKTPQKSHKQLKQKRKDPISSKEDNVDFLINNTKDLVKLISLHQRIMWVLLIVSILSFSLGANFYLQQTEIKKSELIADLPLLSTLFGEPCIYKIDFTAQKDADKYTSTGLSIIEPLGRWSISQRVRLNFILPKNTCNYSTITLNMISFNAKEVPVQSAKVAINNIQYGEIKVAAELQQLRDFTFGVTENSLKQNGSNVLEFIIKHPTSPKSIGENEDTRMLGFNFRSITFQ